MATAFYHRPGSKAHEYEIDSIGDGVCSLKNPDGRVFVTHLVVVENPEKEEALPDCYAVPVKGSTPKAKAKKAPQKSENDDLDLDAGSAE